MKGWRWAGVALIAAGLRLPVLDLRPMHGDEAVMAVKAGALMWGGEGAQYDPTGYHGTLLGWMVQPVLLLTGAKSLADTDERHFRVVTAICGILLCLTPLMLADGIGTTGAQIAGLLLAVSPAFVYWSRFYIQEVPLVLATALCLGCGWRFSRTNRSGWLWGAAVSAGLMLCLKETAWLSFIAAGIGLAAIKPARKWLGRNWIKLAAPTLAALAIPAAILGPSALLAPYHYWQLGISGGDHAHPWHWYFSGVLNGKNRTLDAGILLAGFGMIAAAILVTLKLGMTSELKLLARFVTAWTLTLALEYSLLPYKTPWCLLHFYFGYLLCVGWACTAIWDPGTRRVPVVTSSRVARYLLLSITIIFAGLVSFSAVVWSFWDPSSRLNPYAYAQPSADVRQLVKRLRKLERVHPHGRGMIIAVSVENPWPLPWELRGFPNVGYWVPGDPGAKRGFRMAAVRISTASPGAQGLMFGLRPGDILLVEADWRLLDGALRQR